MRPNSKRRKAVEQALLNLTSATEPVETIINLDGYSVSYKDSTEIRNAVFEKLLQFYANFGYIGEVIEQNENAQIDAPHLLAYIADNIIKFQTVED